MDTSCSDERTKVQNGSKERKSDVVTALSYAVVKRDGTLVPFRRERILKALESAFRDTKKIPTTESLPEDIKLSVDTICDLVVSQALYLAERGACLTVEGIQDLVEVTLMKNGDHDVARDYIIYRDLHKSLREDSPQNLKIYRETNRSAVRFNPIKIASSIESAFRRARSIEGASPQDVIEAVGFITSKVVEKCVLNSKSKQPLHINTIQDFIEESLIKEGHFLIGKEYILYRASQGQQPSLTKKTLQETERSFSVQQADGKSRVILEGEIRRTLSFACKGLEDKVSIDDLVNTSFMNFYEGMKESEIDISNMMAARSKIEKEPSYTKVAARLLLDLSYRETMEVSARERSLAEKHQAYFKKYIKDAVALGRLHPELLNFNLDLLAKSMDLKRDDRFSYLGLQTLYDRYFIHEKERRLETPQIFWMRVAMGLSILEGEQKNEKAIEFYNVLSQFLYVSSTPTLFNSGTTHPQLSSCFLLTVMDDLEHIFKTISDDAQLSKWAGGLGNDWTNVRATGAIIKGTNGKSQGVIPFLKVANDTAVAVNQGGKRKGAMCGYLETWHLDIEDFLELRKNTGDERRRTHDMNTANWIPDLFMKRVKENGMWTLFSPNDVPDLHDLYGSHFEKRYQEYEKQCEEGAIKLFKKIEAVSLWRKMLGMLFETGHPWITFKDPSNIRSPQDHVGVVHSSNLCTEILLNTTKEETAVCNLGSVNLAEHIVKGKLDQKKIASTVRSAIRMLDNVIDINFYPTKEARNANLRHRPIGLGIMGFQDALYLQNISYASHEAVKFADVSTEIISYYALLASAELAKEKGPYSTYKGSKWDRGLLPIDTLSLLQSERNGYFDVDTSCTLDWEPVRKSIKAHGMRNSNTMAIAPTATISNITGVTQSIEPTYKHLYVKSNLSGEFTMPNLLLVEKLKELSLWDDEMLDDLKYFDGSIKEIERIPNSIKQIFLTAFEIDPDWTIECASRRQKWIDMGQSLNLYLAEPSGKKLDQMYMLAWLKGLKTTYYLRTVAATQIEKVTTDINKRGLQPRWMKNKSASGNIRVERETPKACNLDEGCESCQ